MAYKNLEYKNYKVRTPVKSFRDLEVYQKTILLSSDIFNICEKIRKSKKFGRRLINEFDLLYKFSKNVPRLIAESYGDRFVNFSQGIAKIEESMRLISDIVTKIDCLISLLESGEIKGTLNSMREKYQKQRVKINNLSRAWSRVYGERGEKI